MEKKLHEIEEEVELEKKKSEECKSAIKKHLDSVCILLNGDEDSEDEKVETLEPVLDLGGNDDDGK